MHTFYTQETSTNLLDPIQNIDISLPIEDIRSRYLSDRNDWNSAHDNVMSQSKCTSITIQVKSKNNKEFVNNSFFDN